MSGRSAPPASDEEKRTLPIPYQRTIRALAAAALALALAPPSSANAEDYWPALRQQVFGARDIAEADGAVILDAPERAEDAAIVPITVRVPPSVKGELKTLTLIIDNNPSPLVATLTFGPASGSGTGERRLSTRVRVDSFSHVRAIVETADGQLHMSRKFLQAAGGCSAPVPKDLDQSNADLGKIVIRNFEPSDSTAPVREGQVMVRHPNTSGLQRDPDSLGYLPARYVKEMTVKRGAELVFSMAGGISLSSDPNFRFTYRNGGDNQLEASVIDSDNTVFTAKGP
jgi:sulfur-oxidizing protein SoxY